MVSGRCLPLLAALAIWGLPPLAAQGVTLRGGLAFGDDPNMPRRAGTGYNIGNVWAVGAEFRLWNELGLQVEGITGSLNTDKPRVTDPANIAVPQVVSDPRRQRHRYESLGASLVWLRRGAGVHLGVDWRKERDRGYWVPPTLQWGTAKPPYPLVDGEGRLERRRAWVRIGTTMPGWVFPLPLAIPLKDSLFGLDRLRLVTRFDYARALRKEGFGTTWQFNWSWGLRYSWE